jgi:hypothetical protein
MCKVALLLTGCPVRQYDPDYEYRHCFKKMKHSVFNTINPDIYIYTRCTKEIEEDIKNLYKPKKAVFRREDEIINNITISKAAPETNISHALQHFKKMYEGSKLIKEKYDWIIRFRFDCFIGENILNYQLLSTLKKEVYYIPKHGDSFIKKHY